MWTVQRNLVPFGFTTFYRPPTKLRENNVSSGVCKFLCSGGPHVFTLIHLRTPPPKSQPCPPTHIGTPSSSSRPVPPTGPVQTLGVLTPRPIQNCSLCSSYIYQQAGSWPLTERPSCSWLCSVHINLADTEMETFMLHDSGRLLGCN